MDRVEDIKVEVKIYRDGELVNTINETGIHAYKRLATVLISEKNDKKSTTVYGSIDSNTGTQIIKCKQHIHDTHIYEMLFTGLALEDLPRL